MSSLCILVLRCYHARTLGSVAHHLTIFIGPVNLVSIAFLHTSLRRSLRHMPAFETCFSATLGEARLGWSAQYRSNPLPLAVRVQCSARWHAGSLLSRLIPSSSCWKEGALKLHRLLLSPWNACFTSYMARLCLLQIGLPVQRESDGKRFFR